MTSARLETLLLCVVCGCSQISQGDTQRERFVVGTVFTPEPGLADATATALARLSEATGIEFSVGTGGVPVRAKPRIFDTDVGPDGELIPTNRPLCAMTPITHTKTEIVDVYIALSVLPDENCWADHSRTLEHEMIHALRAQFEFDSGTYANPRVRQIDDHAKSGLFQKKAEPDDLLDAASLEKLCEAVDCVTFQTEE